MACKYMYYKDENEYFPRLYCKVNDKTCIYAKRCNVEQKFIANEDLWKECYIMIKEEMKNIPSGAYYVQSSRKNRLGKLFIYVVIEDSVEKIAVDFDEINQSYVYLNKTTDGYKVSLTPFEEKKKTVSTKKTKAVKKEDEQKEGN